ncbi:hypothetical protein DCAR_0101595 [Daucus carota subsp. sativus]|uniref:Uncharacterized protein n=1 Tax=Daucus carota subsp. sativus TaxID=79200 RepID=A0A162B1U4_DAUCS|nr:hypothetical protein DCAR_0101595 [Daucus carota subsp. sativus]
MRGKTNSRTSSVISSAATTKSPFSRIRIRPISRVVSPVVSGRHRNKGCGSRLKRSRELSAQDRMKRKCGNCNQLVRHNARTCPEAPKDPSIR